jgi:hypothetical protein
VTADPAQPYGAAPPLAGCPRQAVARGRRVRRPVDGSPAAYLEGGAKTLLTFGDADPALWAPAIASLAKDGRLQRIELRPIDGQPASTHAIVDTLYAAGFADGYHGPTIRG